MAQRNSRALGVAVVVVVLVAGLAALNDFQSRSTGGETPPAPASRPSKPATSTPPADSPPPLVAPAAHGMASATLPEGESFGPAGAASHVTLGYTYDEATQADPSPVMSTVTTMEHWAVRHPRVNVQIVCTDLPPEERLGPAQAAAPLGLAINGAQPAGLTGNPGAGESTSKALLAALAGVR